jgi:predicted nuclease of restriction endonuclease-like (RecB) superfamily
MAMDHILQSIRQINLQSRSETSQGVEIHESSIAIWHIGRILHESIEVKIYAHNLMETLAETLVKEYGEGYNASNLDLMHDFYVAYPLLHLLKPELNWSYYRAFMWMKEPEKRNFYIEQCIKNAWSVREMKRQIKNHSYDNFERKKEKDKIVTFNQMQSRTWQSLELQKNLESLTTSPPKLDYKTAVFEQLKHFILAREHECFLVSQHKRVVLDDKVFKIDLVFYNRLLRCFVLLEITTDAFIPQDLETLKMFIHYYDTKVLLDTEKPTIALLIGANKNDAFVKFVLPEGVAQRYSDDLLKSLPTEQQLLLEVRKVAL